MPAPVRHAHYLLPLLIAAALFAAGWVAWLFRGQRAVARVLSIGGNLAPVIVPRVLAVTTFLAGTILLFSGATPAVHGRLGWLDDVLPLPIVELSHFFGSIAGVALLILARGIQRRLDVAYHLTTALLGAGILFSLLKAFDYEEALVLSLMLGALVPSRRYFYRRTSLVEERFTPGWVAAIALVLLGSIALGYFSYGHAAFLRERFWEFAFDAQAPRFLRATIGAVVAATAFAAARLVRPASARPPVARGAALERARAVVEASPRAAAHLALLGDKSLLFNDAGTGFVMYGVAGRSWVSMGDPVAPSAEVPDLVHRFVQLADRGGGHAVFYEVGKEQLYTYLDLGLSVVKIGEEARVALPDFTLEGAARRNLRRVWRKAVEDGCSFAVVPAHEVPPLLDTLEAISSRWLAAKRAREKGFSLGFFDRAYVARYPVGVVRKGGEDGEVVAFATAWCAACREELRVDLMRYTDAAPPGVMRYLLAEFMLWGRAQGYRWFNLGMAPLSGLPASSVAPLWTQVGRAIYGYGERFYNFQGVRSFKEWFYPAWEPKYLVSPGGALRPLVLANIATLISGGVEGVVAK